MATVTKRKLPIEIIIGTTVIKASLFERRYISFEGACTPLQLQLKSSYQLVDLTLWLKLKM